MLPKVVFTHRNGVQRAACLPEPVTIGRCEQPAFSTAGQQDRPSLTISLPGARWHLASLSISFLRKPLTTLSRSRLGRRSGFSASRAPIARISLCFISQAVCRLTPSLRPSSIELIPFLL